MRVKSRKPPAEYLITSLLGDRLEVGGGADDVVGDQVRHVAGDREHQVVVLGVHDLDVGAERAPRTRPGARPRPRSAPARRREDAPAVVEQLGEAGVGARLLGAGDRVAGDEMHALGTARRHRATTDRLDRADVGDDRAGLRCGRDRARDLARRADRRRRGSTRSASRDGSARDRHAAIGQGRGSRPRARVAGVAARSPRRARPVPARRTACAIEEPIRPTPISASVREHRVALASSTPRTPPALATAGAVGFLGADGHAQALRQARRPRAAGG